MAGDQLTGDPGDTRAIVAEYTSAVTGRLDAPTSLLIDIRDEVEDGLSEAIESYRREGLPPEEAARAAVAEFGEPAVTAAAFATGLRLARARRTGLGLMATGPVVGLLWIVAVLTTGLSSGRLAGLWVVLPVVALAVAVGAPASELAVLSTGRLSRHLAGHPGLAPAAVTVACVAAVVGDATILGTVTVHVLLLGGWISPVPTLLAGMASVARMVCTGRVVLRTSLRLR